MVGRRLLPFVLLVTLGTLPSCLYADFKTTHDVDLQETTLGSKVGRSTMHGVLFGMGMWGDAGSQAAAEDGGITVMRHSDLELFSVLFGIYFRRTLVVYGD